MALPLSKKWPKYLLAFIGFSICMAVIFTITIFAVDKWKKIKQKVPRVVNRIIKPSIPHTINSKTINSLQRGGHTIFIRHSARDDTKSLAALDDLSMVKDIVIPPSFKRGDCLNVEGKTEAWVMGEAFRRLNIPVGTVYSSPTCRTKEMAQIAFGRVDIIDNNIYYNSVLQGALGSKAKAKSKVIDIIKTAPSAGKNNVISAHGGMLNQLGWHNSLLTESGMFIVKHTADHDLEVVAEITLNAFVRAMQLELTGNK
jgi:hypothetical protein